MTINASHNLISYVGDDLNIDCIVASLPQSYSNFIKWYKFESEDIYQEISYSYILNSPFDKVHCRQIITLNIKNLTFKDSGNYSCITWVSNLPSVIDSIILTVTVPIDQPNYKLLIIKISIPVSVIMILVSIFMISGCFYYQHTRKVKLQQALEKYQKRPLPKKG